MHHTLRSALAVARKPGQQGKDSGEHQSAKTENTKPDAGAKRPPDVSRQSGHGPDKHTRKTVALTTDPV